MSGCCSSNSTCNESSEKTESTESKKVAKKQACPQCKQNGTLLSVSTVYQHLQQPWSWQPQGEHFYFCGSNHCDVVYFDEEAHCITQSEIRTTIGAKTQQADDLICYCYNVSLQHAKQNTDIKAFVVNMTKQGACACEIRNPSGRCCLKDFPKGA